MINHIIIHILPHEIDWFEWQSKQLKIGSGYMSSEDKILVDVTLNLNFINWENSSIPKKFFIEKFNQIKELYDWCEVLFEVDDTKKCLGCGDKRKQSIQSSISDNIIYLDSDIIFKPETLYYLIESSKLINNEYYIISPQIVKLWDKSWDILVNKNYIDLPYSYDIYKQTDSFSIISQYSESPILKPIHQFKFGGGWMNLLSTNLLKLTSIPDIINPYGPDDTYVMLCSDILKQNGYDIQQYILENIIVIENLKYRYNPYSNYLYTDSEESENIRKKYRERSDKNLSLAVNEFWSKFKENYK